MEHGNLSFNYGQPENSSSASKPLQGEGLNEKQKQQVEKAAVEARREENRKLPISCVQRLMRKVIPSYAKVTDESKEMVLECVIEFINFITMVANQHCQEELRKTITAQDLIHAMSNVGFDPHAELLTLYLHRYRQQNQEPGARNPVPHRAFSIPTLPRLANDAMQVPPPMVDPNPFSMCIQRPYLPPNLAHPFPFQNPVGTMGGGFYGDGSNGGIGGGGSSSASGANDVYYDPHAGYFNRHNRFG